MSRKLTEQEKEFAQQVRKYRKLKAKQAKLAEQVDDLKAEILDYLEGCEGKTVKGNGFTALPPEFVARLTKSCLPRRFQVRIFPSFNIKLPMLSWQ